MFKDFIKENTTIQLIPILTLIAFVIVFSYVIWYVVRNNKKHFTEISMLPLDDSSNLLTTTQSNE